MRSVAVGITFAALAMALSSRCESISAPELHLSQAPRSAIDAVDQPARAIPTTNPDDAASAGSNVDPPHPLTLASLSPARVPLPAWTQPLQPAKYLEPVARPSISSTGGRPRPLDLILALALGAGLIAVQLRRKQREWRVRKLSA